MKRLFGLSLGCLAVCLAFGGCYQDKRDFTLNPDGSGKVNYEIRSPLPPNLNMTGQKPDVQQQARDEASKILTASAGVSAWKDVSFGIDKDGMFTFKGTAYFQDLNKLSIHGSIEGNTVVAWKPVAGGGVRIEVSQASKSNEAPAAPAKITEQEVQERITLAKAQFKQKLQILTGLLQDFRDECTFALPGAVEKSVNFKQPAGRPNAVRAVYEGPEVLEALKKLADDDAYWRAQVISGADADSAPDQEYLNGKLFGTRGPLQVTVRPPLKPLFDFAAESAAATAAFPALKESLKLAAAPEITVGAPAAGGAFKGLRVGGTRLVTEADDAANLRPFNAEKGFAVSLIGQLPGSVLKVKEGTVTAAVADNGEDLLPEKKWDRQVNWPRLSKDQGSVVFDCTLRAPGPNVKGLKELSGSLTYVVAKGTKDVDLGTVSLSAGAQGNALDARIESVGKSGWKPGAFELRLALKAGFDAVKSVKFLDAKGTEIPVESAERSGGEESVTLTFRHQGEFPAEAKILVQMYDNLQEYSIPFKVENIDLLGRPMK